MPVCPQNASAVGNSCICKTGFVLRNNQCVSYTDDCELAYGTNVVGVAGPNNSNCDCVAGYEWDGARTGCVLKKSVIHLPTQAFEAETPKLTSEIKTTPEVIKIPEKTPNKEQVMGKQTLVGELKSGGYIRTCPLITCSAFGVAYEGEKISILNIDDSKEWYSIEALDGTTNKYFSGWIHYSLFTEDLRSYFDNKLINTKGHNKDLKKIEMGTSTPPPSIAEVSTTTEKITPKTSFFKKIWKFIWRF